MFFEYSAEIVLGLHADDLAYLQNRKVGVFKQFFCPLYLYVQNISCGACAHVLFEKVGKAAFAQIADLGVLCNGNVF